MSGRRIDCQIALLRSLKLVYPISVEKVRYIMLELYDVKWRERPVDIILIWISRAPHVRQVRLSICLLVLRVFVYRTC